MWRRHSCRPRPEESGRLPGVLQSASRGVGTRQTESLTESLRHGGGLWPQARSGEAEFFHYLAADQVLLDDALQHLRGRGVIPDAFRVDHGNRAAFADAEAVGLAA